MPTDEEIEAAGRSLFGPNWLQHAADVSDALRAADVAKNSREDQDIETQAAQLLEALQQERGRNDIRGINARCEFMIRRLLRERRRLLALIANSPPEFSPLNSPPDSPL